MGAIWRPCSIRRGGATAAVCQDLCLSTILASSFHRNTSLNPPARIWGSIKFEVPSLALCYFYDESGAFLFSHCGIVCVLQGVYGSLIFGNTPWVLHTRGVCIGGWQWQHSDRTLYSSEPQICTGGFNTVIWLWLDSKIVDKHKALQTAA